MSLQTYLPYGDFELSAMSLDKPRLNAQRANCMKIINAIDGRNNEWRFHPAVKMWTLYRAALIQYALAMCNEWKRRGFKADEIASFLALVNSEDDATMPSWLNDSLLHISHRSNLIRLNPDWYQKGLGWTEPNDIPMYFPIDY